MAGVGPVSPLTGARRAEAGHKPPKPHSSSRESLGNRTVFDRLIPPTLGFYLYSTKEAVCVVEMGVIVVCLATLERFVQSQRGKTVSDSVRECQGE